MPFWRRRGTRQIRRLSGPRNTRKAHRQRAVPRKRARADEMVREDRASADENLRLERTQEAIAFSRLLPLEREKPTAICSPSALVPMTPWPTGTASWEW